jgi:flagellar M-ring protein FliF
VSNAPSGKGSPPNAEPNAKKSPFEPLLALFRSQPLPLMLGGAASVAILVALLLWAKQPEYRVLFSNLGEADGGQIISELDKRAIPYRLSAGGRTLMVPAEQMDTLRLQLAEQGLPKGGSVGFELLDKQAFGISQFAEQVNYQRGLEGELARTIESLGPISKARVHLVMAKQSVFIRDREPARASVVINLQQGRELGETQANAIAHLVSSSVPELSIDGVTVVDQNGRLLSQTKGAGNGLDGTQLNYVRDVERSYQMRIENILTPILGAQNVHAQVVAQIDFSNRERTAQRYEPNQKPNASAVRSKQTSDNLSSNGLPAQGVPGALSNTPPNEPPPTTANAPVNAVKPDTATEAEAEPKPAQPQSVRRERMINYEVDNSVEHVVEGRGAIQRLTTAVVINYRTVLDEEGKPVQQALSEAELDNINNLVRQAMGFTESRGDELKVINSPFADQQDDIVELAWWKTPEFYNLFMSLSRYLLAAFVALLLWLVVLRPMQRRHAAQIKAAEVAVQEAEAKAAAEAAAEAIEQPKKQRRKSQLYEQNLNSLLEIAAQDPGMIAMIIRGWMRKND